MFQNEHLQYWLIHLLIFSFIPWYSVFSSVREGPYKLPHPNQQPRPTTTSSYLFQQRRSFISYSSSIWKQLRSSSIQKNIEVVFHLKTKIEVIFRLQKNWGHLPFTKINWGRLPFSKQFMLSSIYKRKLRSSSIYKKKIHLQKKI